MGPARKIIKKRKKVWLFYRRQRTAELRPPATFSPLRQPWLNSSPDKRAASPKAAAHAAPSRSASSAKKLRLLAGRAPCPRPRSGVRHGRPPGMRDRGGSFPQLLRRGRGLAQIWRPRPGRGKWTRRMGERRRFSIPSVFVRRRSRARGWQQPAGAPASSYSLVMTC